MFERKTFKAMAKEQLKGRWKIPALTTLLILALVAILYGATDTVSPVKEAFTTYSQGGKAGIYFHPTKEITIAGILIFCISTVFCVAQLSVHNTMRLDNRKILFADFTEGLNQWWQAIRGALWYLLWVTLWSCLFFIPGIIKSYSYSMMFFVMAEYPKIGVTKAMKISKELTRGYKGELFVLDLSFLGWAFLASIPAGLGWIWLLPYISMTKTNAYQYLKQTAIAANRIKTEDFEQEKNI